MVCRGICSNLEEDPVRDYLDPIMEDLAEAYLGILKKQEGKRKEFFGLRDFYRYACCHLVMHDYFNFITDEQCHLQWEYKVTSLSFVLTRMYMCKYT